ncbi:hypothetical protein [Ottowia thiooxydans]|uniref:hypothetical protein n=1 Tax=Ottowia thiooxydans TaxID=219182 RepID=UPI00048D8C1F|nr:hypothetical protein [Ottowia thiooxydans]
MKIKSILACSAFLSLSAVNFAVAAPQTGLWMIASGENAYGGDLINIDVQDNKVFIIFAVGAVPNNTYFLYGTGTLDGDNVAVELTSSKDLTKKQVTGSFNSSTTGVMTFEGVGSRTVFRVQLADTTKPQTMLGSWIFTYVNTSTAKGTSQGRLLNSILPASVNGGGISVDGSGKFGCEFQTGGTYKGYTVCVDVTNPSQQLNYFLKRSADEAGGVYMVSNAINGTTIALARRVGTSDGKSLVTPKSANESQKILSSAIENFLYNYGAIAKQELLNKE